jgi:hypothetical protein
MPPVNNYFYLKNFYYSIKERRIVMDQLRTLEFVQLQAFARVLQQHNKK